MTAPPADPNRIKYAKYLSWLMMLAIASIYLSGRIQFWMPEYSNMDFVKYKTMAEASPQISADVIQPFVYRILAPWIAGLLPFKVEINFFLLTVITLLFVVYLFFNFLIDNKIEYRVSFALTACFIFNRYFFQFYVWDYFHLADVVSFAILIILLLNLAEKKWLNILLLSVIGILIRETTLIIIPVAFVYLLVIKSNIKDITRLMFISIITIGIFISLRLLIPGSGGEDMWTQFYTGVIHFFNIESLAKKLIIAFIPFGIVPFLFYRETMKFLREKIHFTVLLIVVFILSFFGDAERLMLPFSPVYFVLIGFIIQQHLTEKINKAYLRKFLLYLMLISFLSSFYHLWGVVKLPSAIYSTISTAVLSLITAYLFWKLRRFKYTKPV